MTKKEYERLRRNNIRTNHPEPEKDGYFAFFKLRCLICLVFFLFLVAVDRRIDLKEKNKVVKMVEYVGEETIPVQSILSSYRNH